MLKIIPLGGLGEIGLNMMLFEYGETTFIVDAGLMFPEDYMLGVDIVIPNISYIKQQNYNIASIIITHGHEDHIGALPYLLKEINAPVFATGFTLGLIKHKLEENGLLETISLHEIYPRTKLKIGVFELEFIRVSHSVIDGVGIAIKSPEGIIIHTGDFKINYSDNDEMKTDVNKFAQYGEEGVLALLSDSTNVEKEGYTISNKEIGETLDNIIKKSNGRVIIALFASNIDRIKKIIDIAKKRESKIVFSGRSIELSVKIAKELGYLDICDSMQVSINDICKYPENKTIIVTTGSQGEPMSALTRMASGTHKHIKIKDGDTVILSSKFIPGNEKAIASIINNLYRKKANVIYEKISKIHVSGHAFQEELKLMINLIKPKYFIPIHGEYRHLVLHAKLAESVGINKENIILAENGEIIEFKDGFGKISDKILTGRVLVDGKGIGDVGVTVLKERRSLSKDGFVAVSMALDESTGTIVYGPKIESKGFLFRTEAGHILEEAQCVVLEIIDEVKFGTPDRVEQLTIKICAALKKYFYFVIGRRPVILPFILQIHM